MNRKERKRHLKLTLHPMFLILGVILICIGNSEAFFICSISAFFHELGHSFVAEKYGYQMTRIRLMPFGAELHGDTDCFDGKDEIYIALAGPSVNLFTCIIILSLWWISPRLYEFTNQIFQTNLVMAVFNLLPLFPLDGGRILLSLLSKQMPRQTGAKIVKKITRVFAVTLFVAFLFTIPIKVNLSFGIMAFMLFFSASNSAKYAVYQKISLQKLVQKRCVEWVQVSVPQDLKIYELRHYHVKNRVVVFVVLDGAGMEIFRFSQLDLEKLSTRIHQGLKVKEIQGLLC